MIKFTVVTFNLIDGKPFSVDRRLRCSQDLLVFESTTTCLWSNDHLPSLSIRECQSVSWFTFYTALGTFLAECLLERANWWQRGQVS